MNTLTIVVSSIAFAAILVPSFPALAETEPTQNVTIAPASPQTSRQVEEPPISTPRTAPKLDLDSERGEESLLSDRLVIDSWCDHPLQIAVYAPYQGLWYMNAWYHFRPWERSAIDALNDQRFIYFYAETTDGSGITWSGDWFFFIPDYGVVGFREWDTGPDFGEKVLKLYC